MKKFTILLIAAIGAFATTVNAQEKGDFYLGGTLGLGVSSSGSNGYMHTSTAFNIAPEVGFFVIDNLKLGANLEYAYTSSSGVNSLVITPNVSYYLPIVDKLYYTPQVSIGGGMGFENGGYVDGVFYLSFNLLSLEYKATKNFALSMNLVDIDYSMIGGHYDSVYFHLLNRPSVGVRYYFK